MFKKCCGGVKRKRVLTVKREELVGVRLVFSYAKRDGSWDESLRREREIRFDV